MDLGGCDDLGIEFLSNSNYKIWRSCFEFFLIGKTLWEIIRDYNLVAPTATEECGDLEELKDGERECRIHFEELEGGECECNCGEDLKKNQCAYCKKVGC